MGALLAGGAGRGGQGVKSEAQRTWARRCFFSSDRWISFCCLVKGAVGSGSPFARLMLTEWIKTFALA